jgi:hypothetical protein
MSELKRIDEDIPPEAAELAQALRGLFAGLGISMRRYAVRRSYDSATVSRYLSGRRLPEWEFVLNLLHDVGEVRGSAPTEETVAMLRRLHTAALQAGKSPVLRVQLLERKLAEADQEARRAAMRERLLEEALQDREHRIRDLQMRYRELQASSVPLSSEPPDAAPPGGAAEEHARLRAEISDLRAELERVRALHRQAEERCEQLERQLMEAETAEGGTEGVPRARAELVPPGGADLDTLPGNKPVVHFGHRNVYENLTVFTDTWQVDEDDVRARTVHVIINGRFRGSGLLVDSDTVIAPELVLVSQFQGTELTITSGGRAVPAVLAEVLTLTGPLHMPAGVATLTGPLRTSFGIAKLTLAEPLPSPGRPMTLDTRTIPGSQLLVSVESAHDDPYSCLLDVKGRTGELLRVSGEITADVLGAPAFSSRGALAGLLLPGEAADRGYLLPASVLLEHNLISPSP